MENNSKDLVFNQHALSKSDFLKFHEGPSYLAVTPRSTIPQNTESQNTFFTSISPKNRDIPEKFGGLNITPFHGGQNERFMKGSNGILTGFDDLAITYPINQLGRNCTHISNARFEGITYNSPPSGQSGAPTVTGSLRIGGRSSHIGSSNDILKNHENNANASRIFSRSINKVNRSPSSKQCKKRIRFRFAPWSLQENIVMDRELKKFNSLPVLKICIKIARLLPRKSIRDVAMRIQWLIAHKKLDNIWEWGKSSPKTDFSDLSFYIPDNPNDPDLLAIRKKFSTRAAMSTRT